MAEKATKTVKKAPAKKVAPKATATAKVAKVKTGRAAMREDFAIIETGGKQYVVSIGDVIEVELLGDHKEGDKIEFDKVLMSDDGKNATLGNPYIKGASVKATYLGLKKGPKVVILKYKAKSNRDRKVGHRQKYAQVKIETI